jgi:hypothetical protein
VRDRKRSHELGHCADHSFAIHDLARLDPGVQAGEGKTTRIERWSLNVGLYHKRCSFHVEWP